MNFKPRLDFPDHALLAPSSPYWLRYTPERLYEYMTTKDAAQRGVETHEFARHCIERGQKLPKTNATLNRFVNDAIGYRMTPEQTLFYSRNCYGTADAISYDGRVVRVHDLKTGKSPAKMEQLEVYAALFCLEYEVNPIQAEFELRIYQNDDVIVHHPDNIVDMMAAIIEKDKAVEAFRALSA